MCSTDLGIVLEAGKRATIPLPLRRGGTYMFLMAAAAGHSREDDSAVIKIFPGVNLPRFQ
jgi:3-hydroxyisobutyrate dehydrogenase